MSCSCVGSPHTRECLFEHFMSYSGYHSQSQEEQDRLKKAYFDGLDAQEKRRCWVSTFKGGIWVEDKEFTWIFHGWGKDYDEDTRCEYTAAIIEAECGKIALVRADAIRFIA